MLKQIFKKRKGKSTSPTAIHALTDKAAMKIAIVINRLQNGFANFLNKKTKRLSRRTWKVLIVVFGACWGLFSLYVSSNALLPLSQKTKTSIHKTTTTLFIERPKRNDSIEWMEKIYDLRKSIEEQHRFDTMNIK
jgi:hypothetical protein